MKRATLVVVTVALLAIVGGGTSYLYIINRTPDSPWGDAAAQKSAVVPAPAKAPVLDHASLEGIKVAPKASVMPDSTLPVVRARPSTIGATTPPSSAEPAKLEKWIAAADDPAVLRRLQLEARQKINQRYGPFLDQLAPDQRDRLVQLLTNKRLSAVDVAASSLASGGDPTNDVQGFDDLVSATRGDLESQIKSLLGDAKYSEFRDFSTGIARGALSQSIDQALRAAGDPLTEDQSAQLSDLLTEQHAARITPKIAKGAKTFLSSKQIEALQDLAALQAANTAKRNRPITNPLPVDPSR